MQRLFLDTNVVVDFVHSRAPFSDDAVRIFELCAAGKVSISVSALTLANVAYLSTRLNKDTFEIIGTFLDWVDVIDLKREHFVRSLAGKFTDFEDALQYYCVPDAANTDFIVTRDSKHFSYSAVPVTSPKDFLKTFDH